MAKDNADELVTPNILAVRDASANDQEEPSNAEPLVSSVVRRLRCGSKASKLTQSSQPINKGDQDTKNNEGNSHTRVSRQDL